MRLCSRCNQWGETTEPCTCTEDLIEADQDIEELREVNGRLQYQNDRLAAKVQKLELAEKMAREARARMVEAEQRAEKAEKRVDVLAYSPDGKGKLVEKITEIVAVRLDVADQRNYGIWPPDTDTGRWIRRYRGTPKENLPQFAIEINPFKIEVDEFVAMLILAIKQSYLADLESWCQNSVSAAEQRAACSVSDPQPLPATLRG